MTLEQNVEKIIRTTIYGEPLIGLREGEVKEATTLILKDIRSYLLAECEKLKKEVKKGEQYWMWNNPHNVYEYGVKTGKNQTLADLMKVMEGKEK